MARRNELEAAAGRLIRAIQKEWSAEIGEAPASESEAVMNASHGLLQAARTPQTLAGELAGRTVAEYLGKDWVGAPCKGYPGHTGVAAPHQGQAYCYNAQWTLMKADRGD
jgi:hypothetical protein